MSVVESSGSKKRSRQVRLGVLAVAIVVQLAVLPRWFRQPASGEVAATVAGSGSGAAPVASLSVQKAIAPAVDDRRPWPSHIDHDPFERVVVGLLVVPPVEQAPPKPSSQEVKRQASLELSLQAILLGQPSEAMINGRRYREGQIVGRYEIIAIDRRAVHLERDGVVFFLELGQ